LVVLGGRVGLEEWLPRIAVPVGVANEGAGLRGARLGLHVHDNAGVAVVDSAPLARPRGLAQGARVAGPFSGVVDYARCRSRVGVRDVVVGFHQHVAMLLSVVKAGVA